jgi:hypothetical protein
MNDGHFSINPELRLRTSKRNKLRSALANPRIRMQVKRELNCVCRRIASLCVRAITPVARALNHGYQCAQLLKQQ